MSFELYILPSIVQMIPTRAQVAFQIETQWAVAIVVGVLLFGVFIGLTISWLVTGRGMHRTRVETEQLRLARDNAQSARAQAMNERERAMRELHGKQQEFALIESQLRSTQKQLDQAQAALRVSEQQAEELAASARSLRTQVDELRKRLAESEQVSSERDMVLGQVTSELNETQARFNETQRLAAERQATLSSVNAQLSEYRARIAESDISTAEMQATLLSLGSQLEAHRMRLAEIERRAQTSKEALAPSVARTTTAAAASMASADATAKSASQTSSQVVSASAPAPVVEQPRVAENGHKAPFKSFDAGPAGEESDADRVDTLQNELANLFQQLQTLRSATSTSTSTSTSRKPDSKGTYATDSPSAQPADVSSSIPPRNGTTMTAEPAPGDDEVLTLESVKGIGTAYAARLRAAGIQSVRDLANTTPGHLETIIKAPKWRQPDYANWIRYARMMVRGS